MKRQTLLLFLLLPSMVFAQIDERHIHDSLFYYQRETGRMLRQAQDSVRNGSQYRTYQEAIKRLGGKSQNYAGFVLFSGVQHTNFTDFNASIQQDGFEPMNSTTGLAGFGVSTKSQDIMLDMYFVVASFNTTSSNGEESITMNLTNVLQFDLGYDLIKSRPISLYPFVGISMRISTLDYNYPAQLDPNYTNISNLIINDRSAESSSVRLGYQFGLGLDLLISTSKKTGFGKYLFVKAGTNRPVWRDKYKIHDVKYDPDIKQGDWVISFGLKFANWE
jgi:hypothetical protein